MASAADRRTKLWTYLILCALLASAVMAANFAVENPALANNALDTLLGFPGWVYAAFAAVLGITLYTVGLQSEPDWPEYLGALVLAGSVLAGELMFGWHRLEWAGIGAIPFLLPLSVFSGLMLIAVSRE